MNRMPETLESLSPEERELFELLLKRDGLETRELILPRDRAPGAPLSFTQERLWNVGQMACELPWGNVPILFRLRGALHAGALSASLSNLVQRHQIFRTHFRSEGGRVRQFVNDAASFKVTTMDLGRLSISERETEGIKAAQAHARQHFDLTKDILLRALLIRLEENDSILSLTTHHLAVDGWSIRIMLQELSEDYKACCQGLPSPLAPPSIHYFDYAAWQQEWLKGGELQKQVEFWKTQISNAPQMLNLPIDCPRSALSSFRGHTEYFALPLELSEAVRAFSRAQGITLFMALLGSFQLLLKHVSGQNDIVIGTPISNRTRKEAERLIGNFANNLLLRTPISDHMKAKEVFEQVRDIVGNAFAHQDLPMEKLIEELDKTGNAKKIPNLQVLFVMRDSSLLQNVDLPNVSLTYLPVDLGTAVVDLNLDIIDGPREITGMVEYRADLFTPKTIQTLLTAFQNLIRRVIQNPQQSVQALLEPLGAIIRPASPALGSEIGSAHKSTYCPPRDETELKLARIWEKIIGVSPVGIRDNFFELGGFSLLAVRIFSEVESAFGRTLPLALLLQAPTIEQLARVISNNEKTVSWSSLVPIRPSGDKSPLFFIHAIGGNLLTYRDIVNYIDPDQPVYGFQSRGLDGKEAPLTTVEAMATAYIKEMRTVQPEGPYFLAGTSFGGVVAYEMARQLTEENQLIAFVGLIDSYHLHYQTQPDAGARVARNLSGIRERLTFHFQNIFLRPNRMEYIKSRIGIAKRRFGRRIRNRTWEVAHRYYKMTGRPLPPVLHRVNDANHYAFRQYSPLPYRGNIVLFRSSELSVAHSHDSAEAWKHLALGGMEISDVPGDHVSSMFDPHVKELAAKFQAALTKAHQKAAEAAKKNSTAIPVAA